MKHIPPPHVIVVDDETEKEALPLLKALFKVGLPALYFTSRESELPVAALTGIRLLFLDLRLGLAGTSTRANVTAAAGVVKKLMSAENGPYVLVAWTKHTEEINDLIPLLHVPPTAVIALDKKSCIVEGTCDLAKVMAEIELKLAGNGPVELLLFWEALVASASTSTINQICESAKDTESLRALLYQIAVAGLGDHIAKTNSAERVKAVLEVLNSLLSDSIEARLNDAKLENFDALSATKGATAEAMAKLNAKLMIGQTTDENPYPGNVYSESNEARLKSIEEFLLERLPIDKVRKHVKPLVAEANKTTFAKLQDAERNKLIDDAATSFRADILSKCHRVFVEITPVCDHAQANWKKHRVIPGFLLKTRFLDFLSKPPNDIAFFSSDPFYLQSDGDVLILCLDFRGLDTIELGSLANKKPLFRVRQELLFDIQHRAGSHFSRPGIISLR